MARDLPDLGCLNVEYVEHLLTQFQENPANLPQEWRDYFHQTLNGTSGVAFQSGPRVTSGTLFNPATHNGVPHLNGENAELRAFQEDADRLIRAYRTFGHLKAKIDPLGLTRGSHSELDIATYGFTGKDMVRRISTRALRGTGDVLTLAEVIGRLERTYCASIGVQLMHIDSPEIKSWLYDRIEPSENRIKLSNDQRLRILDRLIAAVGFELFMHERFKGKKRFSLEGGESLIPALDFVVTKGLELGMQEIVLGMAHRGRLNVLANIMRKPPHKIFQEFEDNPRSLRKGRGDVKYHLGYSADIEGPDGGKMHISLSFNPSHLEFVNAVALGRLRAKQDRIRDSGVEAISKGMAVLVHGDSAFIGEGIVQETLNLANLPAYRTGGTLHVVVNNQVGFTTTPEQYRSTRYATDIAKMLQVPIFHVNGEDLDAVAQTVNIAMDFRKEWGDDVVIDLQCYRLRGHNEGDEPAFTQPEMYRAISEHKNLRDAFADRLIADRVLTAREFEDHKSAWERYLDKEFETATIRTAVLDQDSMHGIWEGYIGGEERNAPEVDTSVPKPELISLMEQIVKLPDGFKPHPTIEKFFLEKRYKMLTGEVPLDWSAAEALAFGSIVMGGYSLRLTGQDSERGTFSQRHSVLHDHLTGKQHRVFEQLSSGQGPALIANSPLSEAGVLGFEYGYSLDTPDGLVLWEAQFGDFINCAQVIIDQFLASAEDKWQRLSGLVLLLPHGFEGQGPEHSSARMERFLLLAADENIQVVYPSTPAQYFHVLRRQVIRKWRKPLIIMTPKSLLRHHSCVSTFDELATGGFERILADTVVHGGPVDRIILCSGKITYELMDERKKRGIEERVAILRVEQFYPFDNARMEALLAPFPKATPVVWVQEEPDNMGACRFMKNLFGENVYGKFPFRVISRPASASPASGSESLHKREQAEIIRQAFEA